MTSEQRPAVNNSQTESRAEGSRFIKGCLYCKVVENFKKVKVKVNLKIFSIILKLNLFHQRKWREHWLSKLVFSLSFYSLFVFFHISTSDVVYLFSFFVLSKTFPGHWKRCFFLESSYKENCVLYLPLFFLLHFLTLYPGSGSLLLLNFFILDFLLAQVQTVQFLTILFFVVVDLLLLKWSQAKRDK